ncbi:hypothetical protein [Streptomyces sp. NBC_01428]|uniref:hypothetical protein n=1 Tax=Streptomyces sp. NBC_01428 TaxID=2903861 RepID=UPI002E310ABF|nr:hypothetical protein [Streptomyces sp. NBC_01428]
MDVNNTLIPALAIIATTVMSIGALSHQRRQSEAARLWERRAELYVDLLANQRPHLAEDVNDPAVRPLFGAETEEERELQRTLTARVDAFATDTVGARWRAAMLSIWEVNWFIGEEMSNPLAPTPEDEAGIAPLLAARTEAVAALRKQIRTELKTDQHRQASWSRLLWSDRSRRPT